MTKHDATEMSLAHEWAWHDDIDEEDEVDNATNGVPSEARTRQSRSRGRSRSRAPIGSRGPTSRNVLALGLIEGQSASSFDGDRRQEMQRVYPAVESCIRAARHAERLSRSAAVAFSAEASQLKIVFESMRSGPY